MVKRGDFAACPGTVKHAGIGMGNGGHREKSAGVPFKDAGQSSGVLVYAPDRLVVAAVVV